MREHKSKLNNILFRRLSKGFIIRSKETVESPLGIMPFRSEQAYESLGGAITQLKILIENLEEELKQE